MSWWRLSASFLLGFVAASLVFLSFKGSQTAGTSPTKRVDNVPQSMPAAVKEKDLDLYDNANAPARTQTL